MIREELASLLETHSGLEIVGEAENGKTSTERSQISLNLLKSVFWLITI